MKKSLTLLAVFAVFALALIPTVGGPWIGWAAIGALLVVIGAGFVRVLGQGDES